LGEGHRKKLIPTGEALCVTIPIEALNAPIEFVVRKKLHYLSEYGLSWFHGIPPLGISSATRHPKNQENNSYRRSSFWPVTLSFSYGYSLFKNGSPDSSDLIFDIWYHLVFVIRDGAHCLPPNNK